MKLNLATVSPRSHASRGNALPGCSASPGRRLLQHKMLCVAATQSVQGVRDDAKRRHEVADGSEPRGAVLLVAIVCVAITSMVFASLLQLALAQEDAIQTDARQLQASWLAESAVDRAAAGLRANHAYQGETLNLPAQLLSGAHDAAIEIKIQAVPGRPELRQIDVQVDYPAQVKFRSRQSKSVMITLGSNRS
jgi:hypothetical protein